MTLSVPHVSQRLIQVQARTAPPRVAPGAGAGFAGVLSDAIASKHLGTPYVWGAEHPSDEFDCSGLVQYAYGQLGVGQNFAEPGSTKHVDGRLRRAGHWMVVAPRTGDVVKVQQITRTPTAIRRVV